MAVSKPLLLRVEDSTLDRNFTELTKQFSEMHPVVKAKEVAVALVVGDNEINPSIAAPQGRIITFQDAAASLFDKGLNARGLWVINSTAICNIRISFF